MEAAADSEKPLDASVEKPQQEEALVAQNNTATPRTRIFSFAASLASQAGRVITLPRTKSKSTEETESEASPTRESREEERASEDEPRASSVSVTRTSLPPVLPWQVRDDETGDVVDDPEIRQKIMELIVFRSTYTEHPGGEEEYIFDFPRYKAIATELLLSDPSLREMHSTLIPATVTEVAFWRNFFLRCNALCVDIGRAPYLLEAKSTYSTLTAIASFQKFKRDMFLRRRSSADRILRNIKLPLAASGKGADSAADALDVDLGDLDLDLDGEIDRELIKRRPSRAAEHFHYGAASADGA